MTELAVGFVISCATDREGALYCWEMRGEKRLERFRGTQGLTRLAVTFSMPCGGVGPKRVKCVRKGDDGRMAHAGEWSYEQPVSEISAHVDWLWARLDSGKVVGHHLGGRSETLDLPEVIDLDGGSVGTCAVTKAGKVWCWSKSPTEKPPTEVPLWF